MSRETTADLEGPEEGTCCEFCGAAYEAPQPAVRSRAAARARPPSLIAAEPSTQCEWCGAEYRVQASPDQTRLPDPGARDTDTCRVHRWPSGRGAFGAVTKRGRP
jgi:hypothetical protein